MEPHTQTKIEASSSDSENGGNATPKINPPRGIVHKMREELDVNYAYVIMLVCCFISGLTDGTIYNGKSFFQIYLASFTNYLFL